MALVDADERNHAICRKAVGSLSQRIGLMTVSPVLTEAFHLLSHLRNGPETLFEVIEALDLKIVPITNSLRLRLLMRQYADLPMDFADAALVAISEEIGVRTIFTLDKREFSVYRPKHAKNFVIIP